ncbi:hypothetical protein AB9M75_08000 [Lactobacillus sp. AN1001]
MNVFTLVRMENTKTQVDVKVLGTYKKQGDAMYDADWDIKMFKGKIINQTQERSENALALGYEFENGLKVEYRIIENEYHEDF